MVVPPDITMLPYRSLRMSKSHYGPRVSVIPSRLVENTNLHDGVVCGLMNTLCFKTEKRRRVESLRSTEALVADGDHLTVRQLVAFFKRRALGSSVHLLLEVEGNIAKLLLDVANDSGSNSDELV